MCLFGLICPDFIFFFKLKNTVCVENRSPLKITNKSGTA